MYHLIQIDEAIELRSKEFRDYLAKVSPQISWDGVTIGRIFANLSDSFAIPLGDMETILLPSRDQEGHFYIPLFGQKQIDLAYTVLDELQRLVEIEASLRKMQRPERRVVSPLSECSSLRGLFLGVTHESA